MKRPSDFPLFSLISAAVLLLAGVVLCILLGHASVPDATNTSTAAAILNDLTDAQDGVSMLLRASKDTDEYFAANRFPTLFGARGDGAHDDTEAIRQALEAARATGGTVYLPQGIYRISEPLTIPAGVTLRGDFATPDAKQSAAARTVLSVSATAPQDGAPLLEICDTGSVIGITVYYEAQSPTEPIPYPATVSALGNATVRDIALINPYRGICVMGGGTVTVSGIWVSALDYGLLIAENTGTVSVSDVTVSPTFWLNDRPDRFSEDAYSVMNTRLHQQMNAVTLENVRDVTLTRIRVEGAAVGLLLNIPEQNSGAVLISDVTVSDADTPLRILSLPAPGATVSASSFRPDNEAGANSVEILPEVRSPLIFSGCTFAGLPKTVIQAKNSGFLSFYHCAFGTWWNTCFDISDDTFLAVSPTFRSSEQKAILGQNGFGLLYDAEAIEESSVLLFSVASEEATETGSMTVPARRPSVRIATSAPVLNALDFGVSTQAQDNTAALRSALSAAETTGGTVFLPEGTYRFFFPVTVPAHVRLIGVGNEGDRYKTTLYYTSSTAPEHSFLRLEEGASVEQLTVQWDPAILNERSVYAVESEADHARLRNITADAPLGIRMAGSDAVLENIRLTFTETGICADGADIVLSHVTVSDTSGTAAGTGIRIRNGSAALSEVFLRNAACGIECSDSATEIKGAFLVFRNVGVGIRNASAAKTEFSDTAFLGAHTGGNGACLSAEAGSAGSVTLQTSLMSAAHDTMPAVSVAGGAVDLRAAIFSGSEQISVKADAGAKATVSGCIWASRPTAHAAADGDGASVTLTANLATSDAEFSGIGTNYLTVTEENDGQVDPGTNVIKYIYVPSEESEESGSGEKPALR